MAKSEELDWLMGPPQLKFGDIKEKIWDYVSPGDNIYITGMIEVDSNFGEGIYLENEPVTVTIKDELKSYNKRYFYITVGKNITDKQIWRDNISGDELDIGSVASDDELLITLPNKPINESNEFDWTDDFQWTTDMLYSMLENCNEIKISNYSLKMDSAYKSMGGPVIYTLTRCKEWWDRFSTIELDDSGRGPAEWYDDYDEGRIGLISAYGTKNKNIRDIDWEDIYNHEGWTISQEPYQIVDSLNGKGSELFILLDDKGRPVYDLIPKEHRERIKTNWEDRFYGKNINESDEDPLKWIKDVKTNQDFAKEIYDGLKWHKEGVLDIVRTQWNDIPFLVTPTKVSRHGAKITPGVFYRGFIKYVSNTWGIHEMEDLKEIYWSIRGLMGQKINNNLNESELSWIEGVKPEFNATMLRYGQKFKNNWGGVIRTIMFIEQDDPEVSYEKPMTGLTFKILDDPSGYIPYPSKPKDDPLNSELFMNPIEFDEGLKSGQYVPIFKDESFKLKESELDWLHLIGLDKAFKMYFDKKPNKTLTEGAGISFEARKWGETIYNEIMNNPDEKKRLIIDGYDHPEAFNGFPIDYVVIDFYDRLTGYGQEHSGYDKDGNYVVLLYIQPKLLQGQGGYNLKSVLNHEMKHAWEDYNRLSKGLPSIEHTKESQELYNRDFILMLSDQNITGPIKEILKYYYYLSNLEKSAYLENVYDQNPTYERVVREIARKDFESFKDRHDLDINWHLMNTAYDIPFLKKFKSPREFIDYSAEELRSKAVKITKKINKMRYIHGK